MVSADLPPRKAPENSLRTLGSLWVWSPDDPGKASVGPNLHSYWWWQPQHWSHRWVWPSHQRLWSVRFPESPQPGKWVLQAVTEMEMSGSSHGPRWDRNYLHGPLLAKLRGSPSDLWVSDGCEEEQSCLDHGVYTPRGVSSGALTPLWPARDCQSLNPTGEIMQIISPGQYI